MLGVVVTVFIAGIRVTGADRIEVFAPTRAALYFCDQGEGFAPCLTSSSNYTEWRGTVRDDCGGNTMLPPGSYRVEAYSTCEGGVPVPVVCDWGGPGDYNGDKDVGTDKDIQDFFACLAGECCPVCSPDPNHDGDERTDADIDDFFNVIAGRAKT